MIAITSSPDSRSLFVADGADVVAGWLSDWHEEYKAAESGIPLDYQQAWVRDRISERYQVERRLSRAEYIATREGAWSSAPEIFAHDIPVMGLISNGFPAPDRKAMDPERRRMPDGRYLHDHEIREARPVPVGRRLRAGYFPDRLDEVETKTAGLALPYIEQARHKRVGLVVEVSGHWPTGSAFVTALSTYAAAGRLPTIPHVAVLDRDAPASIRAQLWWLLPKQSWTWLDSADPRWRRNSADFYADLTRNLGAALRTMPGVETATSADLPVVMSPFCSRWERWVLQQVDFKGFGDLARALRAAAPRTSAPSRDPAGDAYRAAKPRAVSSLRTAASRSDPTYLSALGDDSALARWIADKIRTDVHRVVLGGHPDAADDRLRSEVERGVADAAREIAAWWDPTRFRPDGKRRGRDQDVGEGLPRSAKQALAGRMTASGKAVKNDYVGKIAEAIVHLTETSGDHPTQAAVMRHTGIPKQSIHRWWRQAETLAAVLARGGQQAAEEHRAKSSRFIAGPVPRRPEIEDVRVDGGRATSCTGKLMSEDEIDKLFLAVLGEEALELSSAADNPPAEQQDADEEDDADIQHLADLLGDEALEDSAPPLLDDEQYWSADADDGDAIPW
jgi:hypothetical protein